MNLFSGRCSVTTQYDRDWTGLNPWSPSPHWTWSQNFTLSSSSPPPLTSNSGLMVNFGLHLYDYSVQASQIASCELSKGARTQSQRDRKFLRKTTINNLDTCNSLENIQFNTFLVSNIWAYRLLLWEFNAYLAPNMDWIKLQELQMTAFLDFNMAILKSATKDVFFVGYLHRSFPGSWWG